MPLLLNFAIELRLIRVIIDYRMLKIIVSVFIGLRNMLFWNPGVLNCLGTVTNVLFFLSFYYIFLYFMTFLLMTSIWFLACIFWHTVFSILFLASAFWHTVLKHFVSFRQHFFGNFLASLQHSGFPPETRELPCPKLYVFWSDLGNRPYHGFQRHLDE